MLYAWLIPGQLSLLNFHREFHIKRNNMSKHQDYVFRERSQHFDHAVGFSGKVDNLSNKEKAKNKSDKEAYYYYGSSKKLDKENRWIDVIPLFSLLALLMFGFGFFWGILSLIILGLYIYFAIRASKNKIDE